MKFGQIIEYNIIEYNMKNIFFKNHAENEVETLVPDFLFKKSFIIG